MQVFALAQGRDANQAEKAAAGCRISQRKNCTAALRWVHSLSAFCAAAGRLAAKLLRRVLDHVKVNWARAAVGRNSRSPTIRVRTF